MENVKALTQHPAFPSEIPTRSERLRRLCNNPRAFNYFWRGICMFFADRILELNAINPQIAARMAGVFNHWKKIRIRRSQLMKEQVERLCNALSDLSAHVYEIVSKRYLIFFLAGL
ncbi:MAG: aminopeptidase N C-terminal domain-containing protein [Desulfobacterales bacterium]